MRSWTIGLTIWYMNKFTNTLKSKLTSHSWRHGQKIGDVKEWKSFNCLILDPFYPWNRVKPNIKSVAQKSQKYLPQQTNKQTILSYPEETLQAAASESNLRELNELQSNSKLPHLNIELKLPPLNLLPAILRIASQSNRLQLNHDNKRTGRLQ